MHKSRLTALLKTALFLFVILPCNSPASDIATGPVTADADYEVIATVENYLQALVSGDIPGLKQTLSPALLREKESILDSPGYDATLRELYAAATYSVKAVQWVTSVKARIDAELVDGSGNVLETVFLVIQSADGAFLIDQEIQ